MKIKYFIFAFVLSLLNFSCSHQNVKPEENPTVVIERSNNLKERPAWLDETQVFYKNGEDLFFMGMATIPGDSRIDAGFRIADLNAKQILAESIEQKLEFVFQNAEEEIQFNKTQVRFIASETSSLVSSSIRPYKRYFEKIATSLDSGERVTIYKLFSIFSIQEIEFKRAVHKAIKLQQGEKEGLTEAFSKKVDEEWNKIVNKK